MTPSRFDIPVQLLKLSAPVIASMISRTVMGFVDFAMVARLGTEAQAAISPASLVIFTVISFGMGTLSMVNAFVAQGHGRNEPHECAAYTWQGFYLAMFFGIASLPGWFVVEPLFSAFGHEPAVRDLEVSYAQIGVLGVGPALAALALSGFFTGIHRPGVPLIAAIVGNVFNIVANYALIFGHWGFPKMGVAGAAVGTVLASIVNAGVLLAWMLQHDYDRRFRTRSMWRLDLARFGRLCWFGLPAGVQFSVDITTWTIFTVFFVGRFGKEQLAAHNIAVQLLHLSFMPAFGLAQALTVTVGKFIGEVRLDLARSAVRWAFLFAFSYMGLMGLAMAIWRYDLVALFNDEPEVLRWGARLLIFCAVFQVFDAMNITFSHALRGAGDTHWIAGVVLVGSVVVLMGGSYAVMTFMPQLGSAGPWSAATLYATLIGLLFAARYRWGPWERLELFRKQAAEAVPVS